MDNYFEDDPVVLPRVLLVDDEHFTHDLVCEALKDHCAVASAHDAAEALAIIQNDPPELLLLDVELPGMNGLELCKTIRETSHTTELPVIFLSGHDEITDRIAGYSAGGDDYVIKPFSMRELKAKVLRMLEIASNRRALKSTADFASSTAMTVMSSMGEIGVLLEALKKFNASQNFQQIAEFGISTLNEYGLSGAVQIRTPRAQVTLNTRGESAPIEMAIIEKMLGMDRLFQFGNRLLVTYEHVSVLVSNLPNQDADRAGRLRDHLAMLAEGADGRVQAILSAQEAKLRGETIEHTLVRITETLKEIDVAQRNSRVMTSMAVSQMSENIGNALLSVALSESQEDYLTAVIRQGVEAILDTHANESDFQDRLSSIIHELKIASGIEEQSSAAPLLIWSDIFSVGNHIMDEDHKTMIMMMNRVYEAVATARPETIAQSFSQLFEFTRGHFAREEDMMKQAGFSGWSEHHMQHIGLLQELDKAKRIISDHHDAQSIDIFDQLKNWAVEHIVTYDRAFAAHLASKPKQLEPIHAKKW